MQDLRKRLTSPLLLPTLTQALLTQLLLRERSRIRVQSQKHLLVLERVLLLHARALRCSVALRLVEHALHFAAVDQTGDVGVADDVAGEEEVGLQLRGLGRGAVDVVEGGESVGRPDDEAAEMTAGSELEEVQGVDGAGLDTGDVAECAHERLAVCLAVVDDEWAATLAVAAATHFTLSCAELAGLLDFDDVWACTDGLEEGGGNGGLDKSGGFEGSAADYEWDLGDGANAVTTGEEESWDAGCSNGGCGCETSGNIISMSSYSMQNLSSPLVLVDLLVPLSPDLSWCEHTTRSAHVAESCLTSTVCSAT